MKTFKLFDEFVTHDSSPNDLQEYLKSSSIPYETKQIGQSIHIRSKSKGFEIQYQRYMRQSSSSEPDSYRVGAIFLYLNNQKNKAYPQIHSLPYHLSHQATIMNAVMLLGEPSNKSKHVTECIWNNLGLDIVFTGGGWHDPGLPIDYLCLFNVQKQNDNQCSICHSKLPQNYLQNALFCSHCKIIKYCRQQCKEKHQRLHEMYCQQIDES